MWYKESQELVEYGIARFMGDGEEVIIEEPMALVGIFSSVVNNRPPYLHVPTEISRTE